MREVRHVALIAIQQAVETYGSVMMRSAGEGTETIAGIEAGLAHGAITHEKIAGKPVSDLRISVPGTGADHAGMHVAAGLLQARGFGGVRMLRAFDEKRVSFCGGVLDKGSDYVGVVGTVVGHLGERGPSRSRSIARGRCGQPDVRGASTLSSPLLQLDRRARAKRGPLLGLAELWRSWPDPHTRCGSWKLEMVVASALGSRCGWR